MVLWNGTFAKHRDWQHTSFFDHEIANGGQYEVTAALIVNQNPIDESPFDPPRRHYAVDFKLHTGQKYIFLVPPEPDNSEPNEKRIGDTVDAYVSNPVEGGRDYRKYIDFDRTNELWSEEGLTDRFGNQITPENAEELLSKPF